MEIYFIVLFKITIFVVNLNLNLYPLTIYNINIDYCLLRIRRSLIVLS